MHDLERHPILERLVFGLVDDPHAAAAELAKECVIAELAYAAAAEGTFTLWPIVIRTGRQVIRGGLQSLDQLSAGKSSAIRAACSG